MCVHINATINAVDNVCCFTEEIGEWLKPIRQSCKTQHPSYAMVTVSENPASKHISSLECNMAHVLMYYNMQYFTCNFWHM